MERWIGKRPRLWAILNRGPEMPADLAGHRVDDRLDSSRRAIVIGYGPTGRALVRLLRDNEIVPTVVDLNLDTVRSLRDEGIDAIYGDATRPETLTAAGIEHVDNLILGSAGMANSSEVIRNARALNPQVRVLAGAAYLRDVPSLKTAGADAVYSGEGEVALAFIEDILERLGATAEQIDRERARAHEELNSGALAIP